MLDCVCPKLGNRRTHTGDGAANMLLKNSRGSAQSPLGNEGKLNWFVATWLLQYIYNLIKLILTPKVKTEKCRLGQRRSGKLRSHRKYSRMILNVKKINVTMELVRQISGLKHNI